MVGNWRMPAQTRLKLLQIPEGEFRITEQDTGRATGLTGRWVRRKLTLNSGEQCPHWLRFAR